MIGEPSSQKQLDYIGRLISYKIEEDTDGKGVNFYKGYPVASNEQVCQYINENYDKYLVRPIATLDNLEKHDASEIISDLKTIH